MGVFLVCGGRSLGRERNTEGLVCWGSFCFLFLYHRYTGEARECIDTKNSVMDCLNCNLILSFSGNTSSPGIITLFESSSNAVHTLVKLSLHPRMQPTLAPSVTSTSFTSPISHIGCSPSSIRLRFLSSWPSGVTCDRYTPEFKEHTCARHSAANCGTFRTELSQQGIATSPLRFTRHDKTIALTFDNSGSCQTEFEEEGSLEVKTLARLSLQVAKMNPAQLLNPKGYKKEQAKATKKRAPNYGESSSFAVVFCSLGWIVNSREFWGL